MATFKLDLKAALLEPEDWETLVQEKEWKLEAESKKSEEPFGARPGPSIQLLNDTAIVRSISSFIKASSSTALAVLAFADRASAEYRARSSLSRLIKLHGNRYTPELRYELLKLHSAALKGKYSIITRSKVSETRIQYLSEYLQSRPHSVEPYVYKDLVELLSIVCSDEYPVAIYDQIWEVFLRELRSEGAKPIASALMECDAGDVYLLLRHLAVSHILAWKTNPVPFAIQSEDDARRAAKSLSFSRDTYEGYLRTTRGFYELVEGMLTVSPSLVHNAFDDTRLHLLWLKYIPSPGIRPLWANHTFAPAVQGKEKTIDFSRVLDDVANSLLTFPKRLSAELPLEIECLVRFIVTRTDQTLAVRAAQHVAEAIAEFGMPQHYVFSIFQTHAEINNGALAHPTLPFLLFAARLLRESRVAAEEFLKHGVIEALRELWMADFPRLPRYQTGIWVPADKTRQAMRIASCVAMSAIAAHIDIHAELAMKLTDQDSTKSWYWELSAFALSARAQYLGRPWVPELATLKSLAFFVMRNQHSFPGDIDRERAVADDANMIWILQDCQDVHANARLRTFALDVLIFRIMVPAANWTQAVNILVTCTSEEREALHGAMAEFIGHFLHTTQWKSKLSEPTRLAEKDIKSTADWRTAVNVSRLPHPAFLSNPLDRFVMFISNVSRRNLWVASALTQSRVLELVQLLLQGQFDVKDVDVSSLEWRQRTCAEILAQRTARISRQGRLLAESVFSGL
ncbi:hypothetical protein BDW22DRAFT_1362156 [Trametopsis cervina]|nr:hypothetical protein BDW22DRAFT_1362156 [Trametopsis cervina]